MRNILEATNTYRQRKTNSFSGLMANDHLTLSGISFTGNTSHLFLVANQSSYNNATTSLNKVSGYLNSGRLISFLDTEDSESGLAYRVELINCQSALTVDTDKYDSYFRTIGPCFGKHINFTNIDCSIQPEGILSNETRPADQIKASTLQEVQVFQDHPTETPSLRYTTGIWPGTRRLYQKPRKTTRNSSRQTD